MRWDAPALAEHRTAAFANEGDLLVDPFVGGGTCAVVALRRGLRFIGGDVNPRALAFTAARVSSEAIRLNSPAAG